MFRKLTRDLFPHLARYTAHEEALDYVTQCLADLAEAGDLRLTDIFNPPNAGRGHFYSGLVLSECGFENNRLQQNTRPLPPVLRDYRVALESITRKEKGGKVPIRYKSGRRQRVGMRSAGGHTSTGENVYSIPEDEMIYEYPLGDQATTGALPAPIAWQILCQSGENCIGASPRNKATQWLYREVSTGTDDEPKRRGRPRQQGAEAQL